MGRVGVANGADVPTRDAAKAGHGDPNQRNTTFSIHGAEAALRQAVAELIFFAGTNDLRRCKDIVSSWDINVADDKCMDYDRRTPLHVASAEGAFSVVKWLVDSGANIDSVDRHGRTALEEALRSGHGELVKLLLDNGAQVYEDGKLVPMIDSRLRGLVSSRQMFQDELGWEPEWEVHPSELKLLDRIGGGEFGDVFRAEWHGSVVAAKVLKRSDEIALEDFRTEVAILRKIHHPNCAQFLGACSKRKPYIVLSELLVCSMRDAFASTLLAVAPRRQAEIALDFARGMAYLHSRQHPILHRDLKPANLMISGNLNANRQQLYLDSGVIKLTDFGLSKSLTMQDRHGRNANLTTPYTMTGETGSYRYMAPEVFRHEPYSLKVDVYSFAMIVYQLFETQPPFAGMDPLEAARLAATSGARPSFPPRNQLSPESQELRKLVVDCWAADPDERPTFEEIVSRLEALLPRLPPHTPYGTYSGSSGGCCALQ